MRITSKAFVLWSVLLSFFIVWGLLFSDILANYDSIISLRMSFGKTIKDWGFLPQVGKTFYPIIVDKTDELGVYSYQIGGLYKYMDKDNQKEEPGLEIFGHIFPVWVLGEVEKFLIVGGRVKKR